MNLVYLYAFMIYASGGNLHSSNYTNASTSINTGNDVGHLHEFCRRVYKDCPQKSESGVY